MADILRLYIAGFRDSLLCMNSIRDLLSSPELMKRTAQNTVINGVLYFLDPKTNILYEDVDGAMGEAAGRLNEDGDEMIAL